ncbi:hypothetical protein FBALC1_10212 [Flavobacteriales bacterium ALC-1]|nr:hypothetical protein FBALC1_10212 [Flavobacteriales bacterium ALC-1]
MKKTTFLIVILAFNLSIAQETVGLVLDDVNEAKSGGYTLFNPLSDERVFLINNCGEVVNEWDFSTQKSVSAYILENGNLLQSNRFIADIRDWNNNVIWSINYEADLGFRIHHDIEPLPNGNFLVLVSDVYTDTEMFALGKDTSFIESSFTLERVLEIQPVGTNSANIVWEWKMIDHLVQEFDNTKPNFGVVADNPQLVHMDYDAFSSVDYVHANGMDYNDDLDQIIFSSRHLHEVYVIDHSTTTAQAATHSGGTYGKGGDILWRWGNPEVYDKGTAVDKKIGRPHDVKWVDDGVHEGKISVFSNDAYGTDVTASSIHIIEPNDANGVYSLDSGKFLPNDYFWSYDGTILTELLFETTRSGVQIMSNGNALINETGKGRLSEIDNSGNAIWVYEIPVNDGNNFDQFDIPTGNGSFKANRYPENYVGFNGVTFNNTGIIEDVNSISVNCINNLSVENTYFNTLMVYPNPTGDLLNFNFDKQIDQIEVFDLTGKIVLTKTNSKFINLEKLVNGLYLVKISVGENSEMIKIVKD